jgi:sugar phosphate isomerase/epimerase
MHPQLSVSAVSSWPWPLEEDLRCWAELGVDQVGLSFRKLEDAGVATAARRVRDAGMRVTNIVELGWWVLDDPTTWAAQQARLVSALDAAAITGAPCLVLTSGPAGRLAWDDALEALAGAIAPVKSEADRRGILLALEHTGSLRLDLSFVTTLRDAVDAARALGIAVCVEVNSCFAERAVESTLVANRDALAHVQLSDFVIGSRCTPDRAVPGDGDIPLGRILAALVHAGYRGAFELELVGPRIEAEGYRSAIRRGVEYLERLLGSLEAPR